MFCTDKYMIRMLFGKVACLEDPLEFSKEVGKWAKQMVGFSREGQQDPSPETFIESELSLMRKSLYRAE